MMVVVVVVDGRCDDGGGGDAALPQLPVQTSSTSASVLEKTPSPYGPRRHPATRNPSTGDTLRDLQRGTTRTDTMRKVKMSCPREAVSVMGVGDVRV